MQKGSSRQIKSSLRSRSCRVWCDLHHFSSTGRDNRHMDSPHTLPPIYVYTRRLFHQYMFTTILFHRYIFTRTLEHIPTNICVHQNTLPPIYVQLFIVHQNALPPIWMYQTRKHFHQNMNQNTFRSRLKLIVHHSNVCNNVARTSNRIPSLDRTPPKRAVLFVRVCASFVTHTIIDSVF